jgi:hypothetical protein
MAVQTWPRLAGQRSAIQLKTDWKVRAVSARLDMILLAVSIDSCCIDHAVQL